MDGPLGDPQRVGDRADLRTADGEKTKLMMMKGTGMLGGLGGGDSQRDGVVALAEWMGRRFG